jgi:hypothetical protein
MKVVQRLFTLVTALLAAAQFSHAQTWTQTSAPITNWMSIASSADGTRLLAAANGGPSYFTLPGPIYISTNSGVTWIQATNAPASTWGAVASSADGIKLFAAVGGFGSPSGIYASMDGGITWTQTSAPSNHWVSIASSADGTKLAALAQVFPPPDFYTSGDSGNTWKTNASPYDRWLAIASSTDGNKLLACGADTVVASTNSEDSWATNFAANLGGNDDLSSVAMSADGSRLLLAASDGVYLSTNSGVAWHKINAPPARLIASSAIGDKLVATSWVGYGTNVPIYMSTDFGTTWSTNLSSNNTNYWSSIAASADGNKLVAVANGFNGGGIWISYSTPSPRLNIALSNDLVISWIIPSTNFDLQQSSDLISWADVTNPPVLNFTNLQNEVTLSPSNSSGFYRLKTP